MLKKLLIVPTMIKDELVLVWEDLDRIDQIVTVVSIVGIVTIVVGLTYL